MDTDSLPDYPVLDAILEMYVDRDQGGAAIIADAASQPARIAEMGARAHDYVRAHFSLEMAAEKYFQLIQSNQL